MVREKLAAAHALVDGLVGLEAELLPADLGPLQRLELPADRAWDEEPPLVRRLVLQLDARDALDRGRREQEDLAVAEGGGALSSEVDLVAFAVDVGRVAVDLVEDESADGFGPQLDGAVGAGDDEEPSRKLLAHRRRAGRGAGLLLADDLA